MSVSSVVTVQGGVGVALDGKSGRGALRSAIEELLRTCVELDKRSDAAAREASEQARDIAKELVGLKLPGMRDLAAEIDGIGAHMHTDLVRDLSQARRPYLEEIHQLLGLLAPHHGVTDALPALKLVDGPIHRAKTFAEQFPPGFSQRYVYDLLTSVQGSLTLTVDEVGLVQIVPTEDADAATTAAGAGFDEAHREKGVALLQDETSHAVEQHGPQIPDRAQLARLIWLKDPTGNYSWHVTPQGSVVTDHRAGPATGGFTSPAALAKPINALLTAAAASHGGLGEFLNKNTKKMNKRIGIHVGAELAGLVAGDASGFKGAGTGISETRSDWFKARDLGIAQGRATVYGLPYDPIADGADPGAILVFQRTGDDWHLVTCYPVDQQSPLNVRLEELI